jgi:hypothetical protein
MANYLISFKDIRKTIDKFIFKKDRRGAGLRDRLSSMVLLPIKDQNKYYSEKDKCYSFIITQSDKTNTLYKIAPSKLYVNIPNLGVDRWFEFNIKQMKKIETLSNNPDELQQFFKRLLLVNKRHTIILDFEKLENTTPILFKCLQKQAEDKCNVNWVTSFM